MINQWSPSLVESSLFAQQQAILFNPNPQPQPVPVISENGFIFPPGTILTNPPVKCNIPQEDVTKLNQMWFKKLRGEERQALDDTIAAWVKEGNSLKCSTCQNHLPMEKFGKMTQRKVFLSNGLVGECKDCIEVAMTTGHIMDKRAEYSRIEKLFKCCYCDKIRKFTDFDSKNQRLLIKWEVKPKEDYRRGICKICRKRVIEKLSKRASASANEVNTINKHPAGFSKGELLAKKCTKRKREGPNSNNGHVEWTCPKCSKVCLKSWNKCHECGVFKPGLKINKRNVKRKIISVFLRNEGRGKFKTASSKGGQRRAIEEKQQGLIGGKGKSAFNAKGQNGSSQGKQQVSIARGRGSSENNRQAPTSGRGQKNAGSSLKKSPTHLGRVNPETSLAKATKGRGRGSLVNNSKRLRASRGRGKLARNLKNQTAGHGRGSVDRIVRRPGVGLFGVELEHRRPFLEESGITQEDYYNDLFSAPWLKRKSRF